MQTHLSEKDVRKLLEQLKQDLDCLKEGSQNLEHAFESATKHIPVYLKIVKSHIEQLAKVLELETHNKTIDSVGLAEPVTQLMQLFQELDEADIQILETLALETRSWPQSEVNMPAKETLATA